MSLSDERWEDLRGLELPEFQETDSLARHGADLQVRMTDAVRERRRRLIQLRARGVLAQLAIEVRHVVQGVQLKLAVLHAGEERERLAEQLAGTLVVAEPLCHDGKVERRGP